MENLDNVKEDNRNERASIVGGGGGGGNVKTRKGIQWNKYNYYYNNSLIDFREHSIINIRS